MHEEGEFWDPLMIKYNTAGGQIDRFNKGIPLFVPELIHVLSALANYDFGVNPKTCRQCSPNFWGAQSCIVIFEAFFIPTCPLVHHCHGTRELGIRLDPLVMSITTPTQDVQKSFNMCSLTLLFFCVRLTFAFNSGSCNFRTSRLT